MRFLFDTNIITEVAKPRPNARVLNWLLAHEVAGGIPSAAVAERYQGAHNAPKEQRSRLLAELDHFVREFGETVVPFDANAAKVWGEYVSRPALKQTPCSYPDTQIAAIALSRGLTVITRNTKDFPELPVLNPFED
jgi:predicted nucleic acid-binding protein